jgi:hypothetical protein
VISGSDPPTTHGRNYSVLDEVRTVAIPCRLRFEE